jgi:plasmid stability protein
VTEQAKEAHMHYACGEYDGSMKNVQVRNVPERVHKVLRRRAAEAGQSLQEYLLQLLEETAGRPTLKELFARIERRGGGARLGDTAKLIREIREEREEELWQRTRPDRH